MEPVAPPPAAPPAQTEDPFLQGVFASPLIAQLKAGEAPPIYVTPATFGEHAAEFFPKLQDGLPQIGLGVVAAPKTGALVAYNPEITDPAEILAADAQGGLDSIAVPLQTQGMNAPAAPGGAPMAPPAPTPAPSMAAGLMPSGGGGSSLQKARAQAVAVEPPVKQMMPSRGLINGLTSRAT